MKKVEQYKLIQKLLGDSKTLGAIKSMSYNQPKLFAILLDSAKRKAGIFDKVKIEFTIKGNQCKVYLNNTDTTLTLPYNDSLSYIGNVLSIFKGYAVTEYAIDSDDNDKAYLELVKI